VQQLSDDDDDDDGDAHTTMPQKLCLTPKTTNKFIISSRQGNYLPAILHPSNTEE
jgi:hypothetical protein